MDPLDPLFADPVFDGEDPLVPQNPDPIHVRQ